MAADEAYPKAAYPAAYPKSYDYVSSSTLNSIDTYYKNNPFNESMMAAQAPMPYNFAYAVNDAPSYNDFGHQESSDGKVVSGSYNVVLPDGRTQTVTYTVDDYSGYVAKVAYTGEAKYPEYKPAYKAAAYPAPAYPTPTYPAKY